MGRFANLGYCAVLPRDKTSGRVRIARDGSPRVSYRLSAEDERRVADGVVAAARVMEAAGAREIFGPHAGLIGYSPGTPNAHERWAEETRRIGYRSGRVTTFSFHQMSSCRMGIDPGASAVGAENETHEVRRLYVTDASCFPTASGVNPMLSVYGIANRAAKRMAARLA